MTLKWLFDSIRESFKESTSQKLSTSNSFLVSLEIIENMSICYSSEKESENTNDLPEFILESFNSFIIKSLNENNINSEYLVHFFDCVRLTLQNFYKIKTFKNFDQTIYTLLGFVVQNNCLNTETILKISFIFRVYSMKYVFMYYKLYKL
jgi:hypothetical protein